jgi:hypothetical protein
MRNNILEWGFFGEDLCDEWIGWKCRRISQLIRLDDHFYDLKFQTFRNILMLFIKSMKPSQNPIISTPFLIFKSSFPSTPPHTKKKAHFIISL